MDNQTEFSRKLDYEVPITQDDVEYFLIDTIAYRPETISDGEYADLYAKIVGSAYDEITGKFGATFKTYSPDYNYQSNKVNYFLVGLLDPRKIDEPLRKLLASLKRTPNSRVNVAVVYPKEDSDKNSQVIPQIDKELGVNTIYQDTELVISGRTYVTISAVDAADNMVCETFRVKYKAIRREDNEALRMLETAREQRWQDVRRMRDIYTRHTLWHRSPIDGAFMFRTKYGWLTTATHTPKDHIERRDLSLILDFDEVTDTVTYVGDRLPSSDLPEFLVLVERNEAELAKRGEQAPVIQYMAHFHKNEITRNPKYLKYAVPFSRYGVFESGHRFADELFERGGAVSGINVEGKGRGFIILEHGLVRMGVELDHLEDFLTEFDM